MIGPAVLSWSGIVGKVIVCGPGITPVPISPTSKGFSSVSLLTRLSVAVFRPPEVGAKVTVKVVSSLGATVSAGGEVTEKAAAAGPLKEMSKGVSDSSPVFFTVKVRVAVPPLTTLPKSTSESPLVRSVPAGCSRTISDKAVPVPVKAISNGFSSGSLLASRSTAVLAPSVPGVKVTVKVVCPFGATEAPGLEVTEKAAAFVPLKVMPRPVRFAVPRFLTVKVRVALLLLTTLP